MANLSCETEDFFLDEVKPNIKGSLCEILSDLRDESRKYSGNLEVLAIKVFKLLKSAEHKVSEDYASEAKTNIKSLRSGISDERKSEVPEIASGFSELMPLFLRFQTMIEKMNSEFENFSDKLDGLCAKARSLERESLYSDSGRVALPTRVNGVRMSPESFIKVLRYFPVPSVGNRKHELNLRGEVILSHYENLSAMKHFDELKKLPLEYEAESLLRNSSIRMSNAKNTLLRSARELASFHESYRGFVDEYLIALESPPEPEHDSLDYIQAFQKLIIKQQASEQVTAPKNNYEPIKESIIELEHYVKKLASGIRKSVPK